jgi:RND superfamily putative drug exporter
LQAQGVIFTLVGTRITKEPDLNLSQKLRSFAHSLAQLPGGRRTKFAVIGVWLLIAMAIGPLSGKFEDAQKNDPVDYLPNSAESVKAIEKLESLPSGDVANAITVFRREDGLTRADRAAIARTRAR